MTDPAATAAPAIYRLSIKRFRGIKSLTWFPQRGTNAILGGGDVGKTTILDAIGLLLSPVNSTTLSDTDYYERDIDAGFTIEAIVSLPPSSAIHHQLKPTWPWAWNGKEASVPHRRVRAASRGTVRIARLTRGRSPATLAVIRSEAELRSLEAASFNPRMLRRIATGARATLLTATDFTIADGLFGRLETPLLRRTPRKIDQPISIV